MMVYTVIRLSLDITGTSIVHRLTRMTDTDRYIYKYSVSDQKFTFCQNRSYFQPTMCLNNAAPRHTPRSLLGVPELATWVTTSGSRPARTSDWSTEAFRFEIERGRIGDQQDSI